MIPFPFYWHVFLVQVAILFNFLGYCGMNAEGLCVLDLYIDEEFTEHDKAEAWEADENAEAGVQVYKIYFDPRRQLERSAPRIPRGLPINVTIRELLTHQTLAEAVAWLESVPRAAPSTYILMQVCRLNTFRVFKLCTCINMLTYPFFFFK